ncbi:hypothetical protein JR316_0007348 [Psilocybe cubensis]|uniref:Uncharacterized protein n=2 Tax=Psilocybe cubensis TaxID=181762 RepID=A0A8H7XQV2_PSICU|nr:hypothetical protein JR316_0007348 [Psilocybe cubensis]KAH9480748.1 hypothetical protein JR316_0007348 [Psilocybe cubensis]
MPQPELAQELIDLILDTLASSSSTPLAHLFPCTLVSRRFRPRAQRHIFSHIHIRGASPSARRSRVAQLAALVEANPALADAVQELSLESMEGEGACPIPTYGAWSGAHECGIAEYHYEEAEDEHCLKDNSTYSNTTSSSFTNPFLFLMQRISPLRTLTLATAAPRDLADPAHSLTAFFLPFIAPHITTLDLRRLGRVPVQAITACVQLTSLGLSVVDFAEDEYAYKHEHGHGHGYGHGGGIKLKHLTHRKSKEALDTLLRLHPRALDLSGLTSFTAYMDDNSVDQIQAVLDLAGGSLEELHLLSMDETAWIPLYQPTPTLSPLTALHTLSLHIPFSPLTLPLSSSLLLLTNLLSSLPRRGQLKRLDVQAKVGFMYFPVADGPEVLLDVDWGGSGVWGCVRRAMGLDLSLSVDEEEEVAGQSVNASTSWGEAEESEDVCTCLGFPSPAIFTSPSPQPPTNSTLTFTLTNRHIISSSLSPRAEAAERAALQVRCACVMRALREGWGMGLEVDGWGKDREGYETERRGTSYCCAAAAKQSRSRRGPGTARGIGKGSGKGRGRITLIFPPHARLVRDVDEDAVPLQSLSLGA